MSSSATAHAEPTEAAPQPRSRLAVAALRFAHAATASAIGATFVYPIDLVKTRMQYQRTALTATARSAQYASSWDCFMQTLRKEGFPALYKGLSAQLGGQVPEKAFRLFIVAEVRSRLEDRATKQQQGNHHQNHSPRQQQKQQQQQRRVQWDVEAIAGAAAGTFQVAITNPAEVIKVRQQVSGESVRGIVSSAGVRGLYRGSLACAARDIPYSAVYFPMYALMKEALHDDSGDDVLSPARLFVAGSLSGVVASTITCPSDVVKTRLQAGVRRKGDVAYRGLLHATHTLVREEGARALFKGVVPRVLRSSPQYGVMLVAYEWMQRLFGADDEGAMPAVSGLDIVQAAQLPVINDKFGVVWEDRWATLLEARMITPKADVFAEGVSMLKSVSVGARGHCWGVSADGDAYKWTSRGWRVVEGRYLSVSVGGDGAAWARNMDGEVMRYDSSRRTFVRVPGKKRIVSSLSVGTSHVVWAIRAGDQELLRWAGNEFIRVGVRMKQVSAGGDGATWGLAPDGSAMVWSEGTFRAVPSPTFSRITCGNAQNVWGVTPDHTVFKYRGMGEWERVESLTSADVSAGHDGYVVSVPR